MKFFKGLNDVRRKSMAIALIGCLVASSLLVFAGCNNKTNKRTRRDRDDDEEETETIETEEPTTAATTEATTEATTVTTTAETTEPTVTEPERVVTGKFDIQKIYTVTKRGFSEGLCWVEFQDYNNSNKLGVINTDGELIYSIYYADTYQKLDVVSLVAEACCTDFSGGYSVCFPKNVYEPSSYPGFIIIDNEGNETYIAKDDSDSEKWYYLANYNGAFLVLHYGSDFSHSGIDYKIIDAKGNVLADNLREYQISCSSTGEQIAKDLGEGIFEVEGYGETLYFNLNDYTCMTADSFEIDTPFYEGQAVVLSKTSCITLDDLKNQDTLNAYLEGTEDSSESYRKLSHAGGGYFWCQGPEGDGYYSYDRSRYISIPEFSDEVSVTHFGHFSGGYAPLYYRGADSKPYFTLLKEDGTLSFDPILCTNSGYWDSSYDPDSWNGYTPVWMGDDKSYSIVTPEGKVLDPGIDDLSCIGNDARIMDCYNGDPYNINSNCIVSEGFFNSDYLSKTVYSGGDSGKSAYCEGSFEYVNLAGRKEISQVTEYEDLIHQYIYSIAVNNMKDDSETTMPSINKEDERVYHFKIGGIRYDESISIYYTCTHDDGNVEKGSFRDPVNNSDNYYITWAFNEPSKAEATWEQIDVYETGSDELLGSMYVEIS